MTNPENGTPVDIAAEFAKMLGGGGDGANASADPTNGISATDADMSAQSDDDDGDAQAFEVQPTDLPDVAELKRQLKRTMTKKTTALAREREQIAKQREEYQQALRDAETFRMLKEAQDPAKAVEGIIGNRANGGGDDPTKILEELKGEFEPKTFDALQKLSEVMWRMNAQKHLTPYQQFLHQLANDRASSEWKSAVAEYGDVAEKWKEKAAEIRQANPNLSLSDALLVASQGQVTLAKLKAKVMDAKRREPPIAPVPDASVQTTDKIQLTREARNQKIAELARSLGIKKYANL